MKIVKRRFNMYVPFVWEENSEKFSDDNSCFSRKEFAVTFKQPFQITQVSNTMDMLTVLTFGKKWR